MKYGVILNRATTKIGYTFPLVENTKTEKFLPIYFRAIDISNWHRFDTIQFIFIGRIFVGIWHHSVYLPQSYFCCYKRIEA